jgi:hypothetical protein
MGCFTDTQTKVNLCLNKYNSHHKKPATLAVVDDLTYEFLEKNNLLNEPQDVRSLRNRARLKNYLRINIEVYKMSELPIKEQSKLETLAGDMRLPLSFGRRKFRIKTKIKNPKIFDLNLSVTSLADA